MKQQKNTIFCYFRQDIEIVKIHREGIQMRFVKVYEIDKIFLRYSEKYIYISKD